MTEKELLQDITKDHILKAIQRVDEEGYPSNRSSSSYDLVFNNKAYPPKYLTSLAGYFANRYFIPHSKFSGGEKSVSFGLLRSFGFQILPKAQSSSLAKADSVRPDIHLKYTNRSITNPLDEEKLNTLLDKYENHCLTTDWLTVREKYKLKFGRWMDDNIHFSSQSDEEILELCIRSQDQVYYEDSSITGVNFIKTNLRYHDNFISLIDVQILRDLYEGKLLEKDSFKKSDLSYPKFSSWSGTLIPENYKAYANEKLFECIVSLFNLEDYKSSGIRGFNLANTCLNEIANHLKDYRGESLERLVSLIFPEDPQVREVDVSWLIQDFMLYMHSEIFHKEVNYYWVNQGSSYNNEKSRGIIAAPDSTLHHHKRLKDLQQGDILIHYSDGAVQATSRVTKSFTIGPRPYNLEQYTEEEVLLVMVDYDVLDTPLSIKRIQEIFKDHPESLPKKYSPFTKDLKINQAYCLNFTKEGFHAIFGVDRYQNSDIKDSVQESEIEYNQSKIMRAPTNQILYGPPGTGKTYSTLSYALELCGENVSSLSRAEIKQRFEENVNQGHIVFTTFHQSMSYEDFVEGIKPIEPEKDGDPVIYRVEDGIFKNLCTKAAFSLAKENESKETEDVLDFSLAFDKFSEEIEEKLTQEGEVTLNTKNGGHVLVDGLSPQGNFIIKHQDGSRTYTVSKARLTRLHKAIDDLEEVNNINNRFRAVIGGSNSSAYWAVLNAIRQRDYKPDTSSLEARDYSLEEKKEVVLSMKKQDYRSKYGKAFVLIIDEINRGNVSQILGELITLIEPDKRLGKDEGLDLILPYSKERFGVPPNVHIIGTMNTADRSVEALDTALRRRFSFLEMMPNPSLLSDKIIEGISLEELLRVINGRIEQLIDRDHTIGHSYFINAKTSADLAAVFNDKVIPLLQEYFYGDYSKIGMVLGKAFVSSSNGKDVQFADFPIEDSVDDYKSPIYSIKKVNGETVVEAMRILMGKSTVVNEEA